MKDVGVHVYARNILVVHQHMHPVALKDHTGWSYTGLLRVLQDGTYDTHPAWNFACKICNHTPCITDHEFHPATYDVDESCVSNTTIKVSALTDDLICLTADEVCVVAAKYTDKCHPTQCYFGAHNHFEPVAMKIGSKWLHALWELTTTHTMCNSTRCIKDTYQPTHGWQCAQRLLHSIEEYT